MLYTREVGRKYMGNHGGKELGRSVYANLPCCQLPNSSTLPGVRVKSTPSQRETVFYFSACWLKAPPRQEVAPLLRFPLSGGVKLTGEANCDRRENRNSSCIFSSSLPSSQNSLCAKVANYRMSYSESFHWSRLANVVAGKPPRHLS